MKENRPYTNKEKNHRVVVGIGASAGGLDALQKMLPGLPLEAGITYVIVQHLAPRYRTMMDSILTKHTRLSIEVITDGKEIAPNTIYITPPSKDVKLSGDRLQLSQASSIGPKPSIDYFFSSLAEEKRTHAVGIILSGTGTDGAHGIRAIKSNDGITIVQEPDSAKFNGMPNAAIDTGSVDLVLPPEKIGKELESALEYPVLIAREPGENKDLDEIKLILNQLHKHTGADFSEYKTSTMYRRVSRRMVLHKFESMYDYYKYARETPEELNKLYKDLLISVTRFFRDTKAFEALSVALRKMLKKKNPGDSIRIWVPACASGEEAYSIAILLFDILEESIGKYRIQIFATDIDEDAVQLARKSTYPLATVMDTDGNRFEKYFTHVEYTVSVKKKVRDLVVLAKQDILKNTPFLHLDLISCRNLLIYLNAGLQNKLLALFHYSLDPGGLLFLGKSESINQKAELFSTVHSKWKIYQRKETLSHRMPQLVQRRQATGVTPFGGTPQSLEKTELWKEREFASAMLKVLDSSAVMTDSQGNILYIRGDVSDYLKLPEGSVKETLNAVAMARQEIRYVLQGLLHRVKKEGGAVMSQEIAIARAGRKSAVRLRVGPVNEDSENHLYYLVLFKHVENFQKDTLEKDTLEKTDEKQIKELEQELAVTREHLQDTLEELETSGEELQSLNEELQSANEELQASNEELETSNEELQASNEELNTVNQELRVKSEELTHTLKDLETSEQRYRLLVNNMNDALLVCELETGPDNRPTDVIIQQMNRSMANLLGIDTSRIPVRASIAGMPELAEKDILKQLSNISQGHRPTTIDRYFSRIGKYLVLSAYHLDSGKLGVLCRDDTDRKAMEEKLRGNKEHLEVLVKDRTKELARTVEVLEKEMESRKEAETALQKRMIQLSQLTHELTLAEHRERRKLAALLHDNVQQLLVGSKIRMETLGRRMTDTNLPEVKAAVEMIQEAIKTTRSLSHDLSPPVLFTHGLVSGVKELVKQMKERHNLKIDLHAENTLKIQQDALKILLYESIRELLFNIVKHSGTNRARLDLTEKKGKLQIFVSDDGQGFDTDIFENGDDQKGFGLFNIKERLQLLNGRFEIRSTIGKGTRVTLTCPDKIDPDSNERFSLQPPDTAEIRAEAVPEILPEPETPGKTSTKRNTEDGIRIMLVDDHKVMRDALSQVLNHQSGIQICAVAANGLEAVEKAAQARPDVILMDINMPEMDGIEATKKIRDRQPETQVIALTMHDEEDLIQQMKQSGAISFFTKDRQLEELLTSIRHAAQQSEKNDQGT